MNISKIKKKKGKIVLYLILFLIAFITIWTVWGNITVKTTSFNIVNDSIPKSFDGTKIAHISDLHNAQFGKDNSVLINILKSEKPNIIAITGDLVDYEHTDIDVAISFIKEAVNIAPCYYVTGNHEAWLGAKYSILEEQLINCGVIVLHNQTIRIEKEDEYIQIIGIDDPDYAKNEFIFGSSSDVITKEIEKSLMTDGYKILLSHRPEMFKIYVEKNIDLILCGHAHGGQFRLPFIGGLIAPDQGFLPEYDAGSYNDGKSTMIVSRGIGNSIIPIRFNNRPEIVFINLYSG